MNSLNDLKKFRKKVSQYLKEHQDQTGMYKQRHKKSLTKQDVETLEEVLWNTGIHSYYQTSKTDCRVRQASR